VRGGAALVIAAALAACGDGGSANPPPVDTGPFVYRACDPARRVGEFRIDLESTFTAVSGHVLSGVVPGDVPQLVMEAGGCRLYTRRNLFCDPPCAGDTTCGEQRQCIQSPTGRNAGTVSITGLSAPVTMMPSPLGRRYDFTTLPHPGFAPSADIRLRATGGDVAAFSLRGWGVSPLALQTEAPVLDAGKDLVLAWTPGPAGPAHVVSELKLDQHGPTGAMLVCDGPDEGMATIPGAVIDALVALGATGIPKITVARRTVNATDLASGCVELLVSTAVERAVKVPGHDPCRTDADCPTGKTCAVAVETCR
jgi:hypothetical protein